MVFYGIHQKYISEMLMNLLCKMCKKIKTFQAPGVNELISLLLVYI